MYSCIEESPIMFKFDIYIVRILVGRSSDMFRES